MRSWRIAIQWCAKHLKFSSTRKMYQSLAHHCTLNFSIVLFLQCFWWHTYEFWDVDITKSWISMFLDSLQTQIFAYWTKNYFLTANHIFSGDFFANSKFRRHSGKQMSQNRVSWRIFHSVGQIRHQIHHRRQKDRVCKS